MQLYFYLDQCLTVPVPSAGNDKELSSAFSASSKQLEIIFFQSFLLLMSITSVCMTFFAVSAPPVVIATPCGTIGANNINRDTVSLVGDHYDRCGHLPFKLGVGLLQNFAELYPCCAIVLTNVLPVF